MGDSKQAPSAPAAQMGRKREIQVATRIRSGMGTPLWGEDEDKKPLSRTMTFKDDELAGSALQRFIEQQGLPGNYELETPDGERVDPKRPVPDIESDEPFLMRKVGA